MNYPSCIKVPISTTDNSPENSNVSSNGPPDKLSSTTYDELISIADEIFGTGKWSHAVTSQTVDFVEYVMGKYHIGCAAFVRVELPDRTFHEEMGYSNAESSVKGLAVYSARASSITNALKKALLCFGGVIEAKMIEYSSNNKKQKITVSNNDECQSEKLKNSEIIKQSGMKSTLKRPKSPNTTDSERCSNITNADQQQQQQQPPQQQTANAITKNSDNESQVGRTMNGEEMRLERKRKQREKQEEYRRLMMKEKESKAEDTANAKF